MLVFMLPRINRFHMRCAQLHVPRLHQSLSLTSRVGIQKHDLLPCGFWRQHSSKTPLTDESKPSWIDFYAPLTWRPYLKLARIDRPIGTYLLMWPCWWGVALASPPASAVGLLSSLPNPVLLIMFATGAFIMRGAGCVINDLWDRRFDQQVSRTRSRPLAAGTVSVKNALIFLQFQMLAGFLLLLNFNTTSKAVHQLAATCVGPCVQLGYSCWLDCRY